MLYVSKTSMASGPPTKRVTISITQKLTKTADLRRTMARKERKKWKRAKKKCPSQNSQRLEEADLPWVEASSSKTKLTQMITRVMRKARKRWKKVKKKSLKTKKLLN
jgi:hypothetical protein